MPTLHAERQAAAPPTIDAALRDAVSQHHAGNPMAAESLYRGVLAACPGHAHANHNLGILALQTRRPDKALPYLKTAFESEPSHAQYRLSYVEGLLQVGRPGDALRLAAEAHAVLGADTARELSWRLELLTARLRAKGEVWLPDLTGDTYTRVLERLHAVLDPRTYLEIGVESGATLALARCASIGIDPRFQFGEIEIVRRIVTKASLLLYQIPSDDFFANFDPTGLLGAPVDLAFLDGMHRCENLLRDFFHTERHCRPGSVIALHDCLPVEIPMAEREPDAESMDPRRQGMWTGDVWRAALLLKRRRPDLRMTILDAAPTGLVLITGLDPRNTILAENHDAFVEEMHGWSLEEMTLSGYYEEIGVEPEIYLRNPQKLLARLRPTAAPSEEASRPARLQGKRALRQRMESGQLTGTATPEEAASLMAFFTQARYAEAEELARSLTARCPDDGFGWKALGASLQRQGRLREAFEAKARSAALLPDDAEAQNNFGNALLKLNRYDEAEAQYRKALALRPDYPEAWSNVGITLQKLGRLAEAEAECRHALRLRPVYADACSNLGVVLQEQGRLLEAEASYRAALATDPNHADAANNLGITLQKLGRMVEAEAAHRRSIEINPDNADAFTNLAGCLQQQARPAEAQQCYRRAIGIDPEQTNSHTNLLFCLSHDPSVSPEQLFAEHLRFAEHFESPLRSSWRPHENSRDPGRVLRVGFVSADFREHAMSYFIEPTLLGLARDPMLELHVYANQTREEPLTARLRQMIPRWNQVFGLTDAALAEKIRGDGIDILVDLSGHTGGHRVLAMARKPAPIQCGWIGYLGTSGMQSMDYYLADRYFLPQGEFDRFFTEKIVHLPVVAPFQPHPGAPAVNRLPALSNGYITFGSFSRMGKLGPEVVALWAQLLRTLPDARMLVGAMPSDGRNETLIGWFAQQGISPERLQFHSGTGILDYLELQQQVDICLDPFPFAGGTTTCHAMWMGVPTLTLAGQTPAGRLGPAMLHHVGLGEFVAKDGDDFVERGLSWAHDLPGLASLRANLRARFAGSPIGQPSVAARGFSETFRRMWEDWCQRLPDAEL